MDRTGICSLAGLSKVEQYMVQWSQDFRRLLDFLHKVAKLECFRGFANSTCSLSCEDSLSETSLPLNNYSSDYLIWLKIEFASQNIFMSFLYQKQQRLEAIKTALHQLEIISWKSRLLILAPCTCIQVIHVIKLTQ